MYSHDFGVLRTKRNQINFLIFPKDCKAKFFWLAALCTYKVKRRGDFTGEILRSFHRGEIYYADLNPVSGHEQGGIRPVLVIQNDIANKCSPTIIVAAITSKCNKKPLQPTHVLLNTAEGLKPSIFMLESIRTIDKHRMMRYVGKLTSEQLEQIDAALQVSLNLNTT